MSKIKVPFPYMGSKGRFYKEIKEVFIENKRENFIDLFAGAMEVPVNLKVEFSDLNVEANVKDCKIEALIKHKDVFKLYERALTYVCGQIDFKSSRSLYDTNRAKFDEINIKFKSIFQNVCPCCGKKIDNNVENKEFSEDEKEILKALMGFGGKGESLSNTFYSIAKAEKFKGYIDGIKKLKVHFKEFDETWEYKDSFIFLDPPYIQKTKLDKEQNFVGYGYAGDGGKEWGLKDDDRLIKFIENNLNKNNVFLIFGSAENNLKKLIEKNFKNAEFSEKIYKFQTFGKVTDRLEWFCLIK
ncbi:DNA adenine methylase [Fusobacterium ulcerans]|uniref:DNA adenine methylase n=1 Tax=Fusobacterium ulcerans TaxID=861 RepID=UPI00103179EA|nr:DNA adenine methylase [Fusobacterium ulcerans]